jgi:hypothetical protein
MNGSSFTAPTSKVVMYDLLALRSKQRSVKERVRGEKAA